MSQTTLVREDLPIEDMLVIALRYRPDLQAVRTLVSAAQADKGATLWGGLGPQVQAASAGTGPKISHFSLANGLEIVVIPDMRESMRAYGRNCLETDPEPAATEMTLRTASGDDRFVELTARRIDIAGQAMVLSTCQDLSDIRHVQTSLLNMSQVLNQILDSDPVATFVIDADHRVTHWNRACERLTGRDWWDMQGVTEKGTIFYGVDRPLLCDSIVDGTSPLSLQALYQGEIRASKISEGVYEAEAFFPSFGESGLWLFVTAAPLRNSEGRVVGAIETLQDVTERRNAEEELTLHRNQLEVLVEERTAELHSTNRELSAFMENASVGILAVAEGRVVRHNKKFAQMFLPEGQTAVGRATADFFCSGADYDEFSRIAFPCLASYSISALPI